MGSLLGSLDPLLGLPLESPGSLLGSLDPLLGLPFESLGSLLGSPDPLLSLSLKSLGLCLGETLLLPSGVGTSDRTLHFSSISGDLGSNLASRILMNNF